MKHFRQPVIGLAMTLAPFTLGAQTLVPYKPITPLERLSWAAESTVGYQNLAAGLFSAGWGTLRNSPPEYGTHWAGFGKRYGMRLTGGATSNLMEAGLGAIDGEDPHYFRAGSQEKIGARVKYILKSAFVAHNREGKTVPAYARYAAFTGSNFLSNTWRADGEASNRDATLRIGYAFLGRMGGNAFSEFWPDIKHLILHK
jgi:hypothetical protein